jgi:hypothetical protein
MNFFQRLGAQVNNAASGLAASIGTPPARQPRAAANPGRHDGSPGFLDPAPNQQKRNPGFIDGSPGFEDGKFFGATGFVGGGNVALAQKRQAGANMTIGQIISQGQGLNRGWTYDPVFNPLPSNMSARNFGVGME